jgi:hypothetical protein
VSEFVLFAGSNRPARRSFDIKQVTIRGEPVLVATRDADAGAGALLAGEFDGVTCGFNAFGARGKPAKRLAEAEPSSRPRQPDAHRIDAGAAHEGQ